MAFFKVISVKSQRWKWLVLSLVHTKTNSIHPGTTCGELVPLGNVIILFFFPPDCRGEAHRFCNVNLPAGFPCISPIALLEKNIYYLDL